jgi:hypothetical protein
VCVCLLVQRNKNNEGKWRKNINGNMQCDHVKKKAEKKQGSRILQAYENKISYTPEDDHVVKDSENQHNKAARRQKHNLQYPLNHTESESESLFD